MEKFLSYSRVIFTIFNFDLTINDAIFFAAFLLSLLIAVFFCYKKTLPLDTPLNLFIIAVVPAVLVGRLFVVLFDENILFEHFFKFGLGGLSSVGCLLGGSIALAIYTFLYLKKYGGYEIFIFFDLFCSVMFFAQGLLSLVSFNSLIGGRVYTSTVEFALYLLFFFYLLQMYLGVRKDGYTTGFYFIMFGIAKIITEYLRRDGFTLVVGSLNITQVLSVLFIIAGGLILYISSKRYKQNKIKGNLL